MQQICTYVMAHYVHPISLDEIAAETGMNRSAFCSYFKRCKGMTFSRFVTQYRLNTACELLKHSQKQVSEICYMVGFNLSVFSQMLWECPPPSTESNSNSLNTSFASPISALFYLFDEPCRIARYDCHCRNVFCNYTASAHYCPIANLHPR